MKHVLKKAGPLIFCIWSLLLQSQNVDSLKHLLSPSVKDTNQVYLLHELTLQLTNSDPHQALVYGERALSMARELGYQKGETDALRTTGLAYKTLEDYDKALSYFLEAKRLYKKRNDAWGLSACLLSEGIIHYFRGDRDEAIALYLEALDMAERSGAFKTAMSAHENLGIVFLDKTEYKRALEQFSISLGLCRKFHTNDTADTYQNIGATYYYMKELDKAEAYYKIAEASYKKANNKRGEMRMILNMGNIWGDRHETKKAFENFTKAITLAEELESPTELAMLLSNISYIYADASEFDKAFSTALRAKDISLRIGSKKLLETVYSTLSDLYAAKGDYKNAFEQDRLSSRYRDTLFNDESNKKVKELEIRYETSKKESEIRILNKDKANQRNIIVFVSCFALALVALAVLVLRSNYQRKKANEAITKQKEIIEEKQREILDSIHYAKRIQTALMPREKYISKNLDRLTKKV